MTIDKFGHHVAKRQKLEEQNQISDSEEQLIKLKMDEIAKEIFDRVTQEIKKFKVGNIDAANKKYVDDLLSKQKIETDLLNKKFQEINSFITRSPPTAAKHMATKKYVDDTMIVTKQFLRSDINNRASKLQNELKQFMDKNKLIQSSIDEILENNKKMANIKELKDLAKQVGDVSTKMLLFGKRIDTLDVNIKQLIEFKKQIVEMSNKVLSLDKEVVEVGKKVSSLEQKHKNLDPLTANIEDLKKFIQTNYEKLTEEINKIHEKMGTNIREIIYANSKEKIEELKGSITNIEKKRNETINKLLNGKQINEMPLQERRKVGEVNDSFKAVNKKLEEELNKIAQGLTDSDNKKTDYLRTTIKHSLDRLANEITKITEYFKDEDIESIIKKLNIWQKSYKSFFDEYSTRKI